MRTYLVIWVRVEDGQDAVFLRSAFADLSPAQAAVVGRRFEAEIGANSGFDGRIMEWPETPLDTSTIPGPVLSYSALRSEGLSFLPVRAR